MYALPDRDRCLDTTPPRRKGVLLLAGLLFVLSLFCLSARIGSNIEWGDEGFFANGALRVLGGEVIYRDFQLNYPPGRCFALALLIALFGHSLMVVRLFWAATHAAAVSVVFLASRRLMPTPFSLLVSATVLLNMATRNKSVELLLSAGIVLVLFRVLERRTSSAGAGFWLAVAGIFRHDVSVFGVLLFFLALFLRTFIEPTHPDRHSLPSRLKACIRPAGAFLLAYALTLLPLAIYLLVNGAAKDALYDLTVSGYLANRMMSIPFPVLIEAWNLKGIVDGLTSETAAFYIPLVLYALGFAVAFKRFLLPGDRGSASRVLLLCVLGSGLYLQILNMTGPGHLSKAYIPAHILVVYLLFLAVTALLSALKRRSFLKAAVRSILLAGAVYLLFIQVWTNVADENSIFNSLRSRDQEYTVDLPHGWMRFSKTVKTKHAFAEILPYADAKDEYLVVFPAGAIVNFLFNIQNPLPFDALRPGELRGNDPAVLAEIMNRLEEVRPRFFIRTIERSNPELCSMIGDFLLRHSYEPIPTGRFILFVRR